MATTRVPPPIPSRSTLRKNTPPSDSEPYATSTPSMGSSSSGIRGLVTTFDPNPPLKSPGKAGSLVGGLQSLGSSTSRPALEKSNSATPLGLGLRPSAALPTGGGLNQTAPGSLPHHARPAFHATAGNSSGAGTPPAARPVSMAGGPVTTPSSPVFTSSQLGAGKFTPPRPPPRTRPISVMPGLMASMPATYRSPSSSHHSSASSTNSSSSSNSSSYSSSSPSLPTSSSSSTSSQSPFSAAHAPLSTPPTTSAPPPQSAPSFPPLLDQPPSTPPPPPPSAETFPNALTADSNGSGGAAAHGCANGRLIPTTDGHSLYANGGPAADSLLYQSDSLDEWREAEEDIGIEGAEWGEATEGTTLSLHSSEGGVPGLPLDMDTDEWEFEEITEEAETEEEPHIPFSPRMRSTNFPLTPPLAMRSLTPAEPSPQSSFADSASTGPPPIPPLPLSVLQHHSGSTPLTSQNAVSSTPGSDSPHSSEPPPPLLRPASAQLPPVGSPATRESLANAQRLVRPFSTPGNVAPVALSSSLPSLPHYSAAGSRPTPPPRATKPVLTAPDERVLVKSHVQATIRSNDLNAMLERKLEAMGAAGAENALRDSDDSERDREKEREREEKEREEKEKDDVKKKKEKDATQQQPEKKKFWQGTMRSKDKKTNSGREEEHDKEKEKEREKEREKEKEKEREAKEREKEKEAKEREERERQKEENKEKRMTFVGKKFRVTRKKKPESKPSKDKKPSCGSIIISAPAGAQHRLHVDFDFQWTGSDPASEFKLIAKLGQGAYGKVYKAEHKDTGFILAIKCIPIPEELAEDAEKDIDTLRKEIGVLKKCRCESIVSYFGVCFRNSSLWIMMESCDMGSLTDVLNVVGHDKVSEVDMAYILREVVKGLIYLHSINIAHRDMKAANVLLTKTGQPKIADFGTSVQLQNATKGAQTFTGTPLFMSPEALSEESYGVKADIWSLGITAIQIADGKPPLADMNVGRAMLAIIHGSSPTLKEPKKWSKEFNDFLAVCLRKSPDDRPEAEELLKHPFLMNAKEVHVLSFLKEYRLKVKDRPALERTFSFIQQSDPRQFRQSHSPSAELIKQSILADSSKQGLQRVSQDMSSTLTGTGNSAGIPNSPLNAPPSPYAPQLSSSPTASGGSASSSPPMGALRHPNSPGLSPPATAAASAATSAVGPPEIDLHTAATASKPIDIGSPSQERRLSPLTRVNTGDLRRASIAPESEARRMSVAGSGPTARPSTTYGHMTPIVLDPSDRPATTSGESGLGSKKSFHSQLSAKLDKKAEDEKKSRPSLSRPKSDRALQRQVLDSKASTLRDTKTKDKADSELKANLELRNSSEEIRRRSPIDSDEPALDAALQNSERLEDLVGILKDLLAKERLRVREASDEIGKWKKIANDLQRELDDLKLSLEHPS